MPIKPYIDEQRLIECAELGRALSSHHRINMIQYLSQQEFSVENLSQLLELSVANTSQHLQQLKRAGLVESRREGKMIFYRLASGPVLNILSALKLQADYARREFSQLINQQDIPDDKLAPIEYDELIDGIKNKRIMLIDVRSQDEYEKDHLPGAMSIPIEELEYHLAQFPKDKEIVAYCRGAYCFLSKNAVITLNLKGFQARYFKEGITSKLSKD
ncbi:MULTISPECIES: ArsR/SmtB family transcription factor [Enterobacterales]|uniref:ArsR/SmtB family transcription factor n=1 Tax=Enterobacterales TaxID=91347 RepID=UPI000847F5F0|nr:MULTISPECIES: metalloregulator ArsR/SmtB family transcription factor [Enterobacterales]WOO51539.1 metalloregulator ArsR/SmtB family transcription factor [Hafnia alvei]MCT6516754.1 metalloregulator ArsR/SmtB family transcription factor [Proteus vulgaris]ODQ04575.1 hypothetical protein BGK50_05835 [Shigella sp. FC130]OEI92110.1 hypothetical protein BHE86_07330 [Shigella sp. FC1655]OEJ04936.1 hypothetical protein BHE89_07450 [Shigella sp. FC1967]